MVSRIVLVGGEGYEGTRGLEMPEADAAAEPALSIELSGEQSLSVAATGVASVLDPEAPSTFVMPFEVTGNAAFMKALKERDIAFVFRALQAGGISQREIGRIVALQQKEVFDIVNGRRTVAHYDLLVRIAKKLGIPRGWMGLAYVGPELDGREEQAAGQAAVEVQLVEGTVVAAETAVALGERVAAEAVSEPDPQEFHIRKVVWGNSQDGKAISPTLTGGLWTGREIRQLREALCMTIHAFANHLGLGDSTISRWEARGTDICPRPHNQAVLTYCLRMADEDALRRFASTVNPKPN